MVVHPRSARHAHLLLGTVSSRWPNQSDDGYRQRLVQKRTMSGMSASQTSSFPSRRRPTNVHSFSTNTSTDNVSDTTVSSPRMWMQALQQGYQRQCHDDGSLPLFSKRQEAAFLSKWKQKQKEQGATKDALTDKSSPHRAAVLILLCQIGRDQATPSIIFTKRASHLSSHANEISFPGGHYEEMDGTEFPIGTAIREAQEELVHSTSNDCLHLKSRVSILGPISPALPALRGTPVTAVLGILCQDVDPMNTETEAIPYVFESAEEVSQTFPGDPSEVDQVFGVSVQELLDVETSHVLPENRFGLERAPKFPTKFGDIWGLTAYFVRPLLHRYFRPSLGLATTKRPDESTT